MLVTFEKQYLLELYSTGQTTDKKYRFQPDVVKRFKVRIDTLIAAQSPEVLYQIGALHFEALIGNKKGLYSIRVNHKYRIEFSMKEKLEEPIITICNIVELSNHYD